jgi:hypothetical protein
MARSAEVPTQTEASKIAVAAVVDFLGGPRVAGNGYTFDFGQHLEATGEASMAGHSRRRLCLLLA